MIGAIDGAARVPSYGTEQIRLAGVEENTRRRLGSDAYDRLHRRGRATSLDRIIGEIIAEVRQLVA